MKVRDIMTPRPRCRSPDAMLEEAARMMLETDVGEIPVSDEGLRAVGVITDRDIVVRCVATGGDPRNTSVQSCMTAPALTLTEDASLEECARLMAGQQLRRVPIVDANGTICGIVAQADLEATDARSLKAAVAERVSTRH
jgi:CBS-domain-containing membrane protein